jgi:Insect cuticle protein
MAAKFITFFGLVAVASAGLVAQNQWNAAPAEWSQPATIIKQIQPAIIKKVIAAVEEPANYNFNYAVNEPSTGDVKSQQEEAKNGAIWGSYQLEDADGFLRIVDYTADDTNGFQATVRREPLHAKKIIAAPVHKYVQAAPKW